MRLMILKNTIGQTRGGQTGPTAPGLTVGCFKAREKINSIKLR